MIGTPIAAAQAWGLAAVLQAPHAQPLDSVAVESPLPRGVAEVVRFLLTTVPPWIQIGGLVLAAIVSIAVVWLLISRRKPILRWIGARSTAVKVGLSAAAILFVVGAGGAGAVTWNYTQHSNDFCTGCHVMDPAVERMTGGESSHAKLSCHSCHQQSIAASAWQLYMWVSERPAEIEKHANVPNRVCEGCHVTQDTARWQRIAATAGHRVHLESDSSILRDLRCLDCHSTELHVFQPVKQTCGQTGCHAPEETGIVLAKMAGQTVRHCTTCHEFTAGVPALATRDSAETTLVPGSSQCLGCHEMRKVLRDFDEARDPHGGKCGMCHNPHTQKTAEVAANSCATAGCHSSWRDEPFHVGASHRSVGSQCLTCHLPHRARVDASECQGCHESVRARGTRRPPLPFDTTAALRRSELAEPRVLRSVFEAGSEPASVRLGVGPPPPEIAAPDSFPHSRHERLACLECHQTGEGHGRLTFERPRGCFICHHQAPARARCETCHRTAEYSEPKVATATVTVRGHPPRPRLVEFRHAAHASRTCLECHSTPVTLAPAASKAVCRDCHDDHHTARRECSACHAVVQPGAAHKSLEAAHQRCDACHAPATIARLTPTRSFCAACHVDKTRDHYVRKECTVCHFLAEPDAHRARLLSRMPQ